MDTVTDLSTLVAMRRWVNEAMLVIVALSSEREFIHPTSTRCILKASTVPCVLVSGLTRLVCCFVTVPCLGCVRAVEGDVCGTYVTKLSDDCIDGLCTESNRTITNQARVNFCLTDKYKAIVKPAFNLFVNRFAMASASNKYKMADWLTKMCSDMGLEVPGDLTPYEAVRFIRDNGLV